MPIIHNLFQETEADGMLSISFDELFTPATLASGFT